MKVFIGPAGVPLSCPKSGTINGIKCVAELGLNLMEVQFVRSVRMKEEKAKEAGEIARELGVRLSVHAPYYINLASERKEVIERSVEDWLYKASKLGYLMGAKFIVFHPAAYGKREPEEVFEIVKKNVKRILRKLDEEDINVYLAPETMGKKGQFGSIDEIVNLVKEIRHPKLRFCLDFAHMHARDQGRFKEKKHFNEIFEKIYEELGEEYLKELHIHFSSIEYTEKGEKAHLPLEEKEPDFEILADVLKEWKGYIKELEIVSESPILEKDALLMKKILKRKRLLK